MWEPPPLGEEEVAMEEEVSRQFQPDCAVYLAGVCISGQCKEDSYPLLHRKCCSTFMKWGDQGEMGCQQNPCDKIHQTGCQ